MIAFHEKKESPTSLEWWQNYYFWVNYRILMTKWSFFHWMLNFILCFVLQRTNQNKTTLMYLWMWTLLYKECFERLYCLTLRHSLNSKCFVYVCVSQFFQSFETLQSRCVVIVMCVKDLKAPCCRYHCCFNIAASEHFRYVKGVLVKYSLGLFFFLLLFLCLSIFTFFVIPQDKSPQNAAICPTKYHSWSITKHLKVTQKFRLLCPWIISIFNNS